MKKDVSAYVRKCYESNGKYNVTAYTNPERLWLPEGNCRSAGRPEDVSARQNGKKGE